MAKKYLYVFIFILMIWGSTLVRAATTNDNMSKIIDTAVINKYIKLSFEYKSFVPFAIYNSLEALELAKKIKYQKGINEIVHSLQSTVNGQLSTVNYGQWTSLLMNKILNNSINLYMTLYDSLGYYYLKDGQEDKALECFRSIERIRNYELGMRNEILISDKLKKSELNGIAGCYTRIGLQFNQEDYEISIEYANKALNIYKESENRLGLGKCYNNIGYAYINFGNNLLALDYLLKSLKINEDLKYKKGLAHCNFNIGIVYLNEKDYTKALNYAQKAFSIYEEIKDKPGILKCYNILGNIYSNKNNYIKAIEFYNHALKIGEELQDKGNMAIILNNIGNTYKNLGDYSRSLECFNKGLNINKKNDDKIIKLYLLNNIADTYLKLKRYNEALEYALKSSKSAKKLKELVIENDGYRILKEIYKFKGDYRKEAECGDLYKSTGDSLYNSNKSKQILEIQTKYETEKKDKDIQLLNKNNEIKTIKIGKQKAFINYMIGGFILLIFVIFLILRTLKIITRNKKLIEKLHQQEKLQIKTELDVKEAELERNKAELERNKAEIELKNMDIELKNMDIEIKNKDIEIKNKDMEHFALRIVEKNEFIEYLEKEVDALEGTEKDKKQLLKIINNIRNQIALEREVYDIENKINEFYYGFFQKLNNRHPELTKTENKICSLMLLNFANKQIATWLNLTSESLKKDRNRLRKKLNLNSEDDIANYLKTL